MPEVTVVSRKFFLFSVFELFVFTIYGWSSSRRDIALFHYVKIRIGSICLVKPIMLGEPDCDSYRYEYPFWLFILACRCFWAGVANSGRENSRKQALEFAFCAGRGGGRGRAPADIVSFGAVVSFPFRTLFVCSFFSRCVWLFSCRREFVYHDVTGTNYSPVPVLGWY